ncbi:hypothetical protein RSOL_239960, partial [Rhizoctonia solani AG-3 Rhs1AP]
MPSVLKTGRTEELRAITTENIHLHPLIWNSTGSLSAILTSYSQFNLDNLIDQLTRIATFQAAREVTSSGDNGIKFKEEWLIESASPEDPTTEPSVWLRHVQQTTPPLSWEDYWNTLRGEGLANNKMGVGSNLVDRIIPYASHG